MTSRGSPSSSLRPPGDRHQPIDDRQQRVDDVLDPHDGHAGRSQVLHRGDERLELGLGEPAAELVQEQDVGRGRPCPGELELLALQQRQRARQGVRARGQARALERLDGERRARLPLTPAP
jgi:hypothetical protein